MRDSKWCPEGDLTPDVLEFHVQAGTDAGDRQARDYVAPARPAPSAIPTTIRCSWDSGDWDGRADRKVLVTGFPRRHRLHHRLQAPALVVAARSRAGIRGLAREGAREDVPVPEFRASRSDASSRKKRSRSRPRTPAPQARSASWPGFSSRPHSPYSRPHKALTRTSSSASTGASPST